MRVVSVAGFNVQPPAASSACQAGWNSTTGPSVSVVGVKVKPVRTPSGRVRYRRVSWPNGAYTPDASSPVVGTFTCMSTSRGVQRQPGPYSPPVLSTLL